VPFFNRDDDTVFPFYGVYSAHGAAHGDKDAMMAKRLSAKGEAQRALCNQITSQYTTGKKAKSDGEKPRKNVDTVSSPLSS
jgi:hypothetical protein